MKYPATFTPDLENGGFVVTFRDVPEAITQGDTEDEAVEMARDVLAEAMRVYVEEKRVVPLPSIAEQGDRLIDLPGHLCDKV